MKKLFCICIIFTYFSGFSQTLSLKNGTTRAVVIGVADYLDDGIPDLQFSNKDAEAFAAYLQSDAGGKIPNENILLLTDSDATTGQMYAALDWLIEESQPNDKAIIYFSGHGDVETTTRRQRGFLLTHDSPPNNYRAGAYAIVFLQDVIETLSLDKETQVIMISDACRAGKLAGSNINGTQATSAALSQQFANEIKILSCQPEEFSLEGEQWGGGRGCFSYHLLDGLSGMADRNGDLAVNLMELERYLEDNVTVEAAPHSQIPMTVGKKSAVIGNVNADILAQLKKDKETNQVTFAAIETRGIEDLILANSDSTVQEIYGNFLAAIDNGHLMSPEGKSANDYYETLSKKEGVKKLHGFMKRNFAAALMDESQVALNNILEVKPDWIDNQNSAVVSKARAFPKYLNKAAELLGNDHYMYSSLKSKEYYFKGFVEESIGQYPGILDDQRLAYFNKAIEFDSNAYYAYYALAQTYQMGYDFGQAENYCDTAIELSPNWLLPYLVKSYSILQRLNADSAITILNKALTLDSTYAQTYLFLSDAYAMKEDLKKSKTFARFGKKLIEDNIDNINNFDLLNYIFFVKVIQEDLNAPERLLKQILAKDSTNSWYHYQLGRLYHFDHRNYKKSRKSFERALLLDSLNIWAPINLAQTYAWQGQLDSAEIIYKHYQKYHPNYFMYDTEIANIYAMKKDNNTTKNYLLQAYKKSPFSVLHSYYFKFFEEEEKENIILEIIEKYSKNGYVNNLLGDIFVFDYKDYTKGEAYYKTSEKLGYPAYRSLGRLYAYELNDFDRAEPYYLKAIKQCILLGGYHQKSNQAKMYKLIIAFYKKFEKFEKAAKALETSKDFFTDDSEYYLELADLYFLQGKHQDTYRLLDSVTYKNKMYMYYEIALAYQKMNDLAKAEEIIQESLIDFPEDNIAIYNVACLYSLANMPVKALSQLEISFQKGYYDIEHMKKDTDLDNIRDTQEFKDLIIKYFPDKGKE